MRLLNLLLLFLLAGFAGGVQAQNLFLPQSLNTPRNDYPVGFMEHDGAYYFVGTQWPTTVAKSSSGFCYKTDVSGNVLQAFTLNGIDSNSAYTFEAVYSHRDLIYIVATKGSFKNDSFLMVPSQGGYYDGYDYSKLLVLQLDKSLMLRQIDTLQYDTDGTDITSIRSVIIGSRIYIAYSGLRKAPSTNPDWVSRSFISAYDMNSGSFRQQPVDSAYLSAICMSGYCYGNKNHITSLTRTGDSQFLLGGFFVPQNGFEGFPEALQIDTNLAITRLPLRLINNFQQPGMMLDQNYLEMWKPTATSSYFIGPLLPQWDTTIQPWRGPMSMGRLEAATHQIQLSPAVPIGAASPKTYQPARKNPMTLLRDQKHFVLACDAYTYDAMSQIDSARIRIAKYDTSLNLIWNRDFGKPYSFFTTAGVHELSSGKLMVISALNDFIAGRTTDLYCFIIDSNGTPLSTFSVPISAQKKVKIYPNPATSEIRFELPDGQASATYWITSTSGQLVQQGSVISGNPISVSALPAANYLFRIQMPDGRSHTSVFTKQ